MTKQLRFFFFVTLSEDLRSVPVSTLGISQWFLVPVPWYLISVHSCAGTHLMHTHKYSYIHNTNIHIYTHIYKYKYSYVHNKIKIKSRQKKLLGFSDVSKKRFQHPICPRRSLGDPQQGISTYLNLYHAIQLFPRTGMKPKPSSCISSVNPLFLFLPNQIKNRLETGEELDVGKLC